MNRRPLDPQARIGGFARSEGVERRVSHLRNRPGRSQRVERNLRAVAPELAPEPKSLDCHLFSVAPQAL
jgi:hypothetical protein